MIILIVAFYSYSYALAWRQFGEVSKMMIQTSFEVFRGEKPKINCLKHYFKFST